MSSTRPADLVAPRVAPENDGAARGPEPREASALLARAALVLGIVLLLGGTAHLAGILARFASKGVPDGHRVVFLLFISFIHWACGALDVLASRGLRRGESWARPVLTISALLVTGYGASMTPVLVSASLPLRVMPVVYPLVSLAIASAAWLRSPARSGAPLPG